MGRLAEEPHVHRSKYRLFLGEVPRTNHLGVAQSQNHDEDWVMICEGRRRNQF
jgi:hypothetical protein